jgi:hypothetical protein
MHIITYRSYAKFFLFLTLSLGTLSARGGEVLVGNGGFEGDLLEGKVNLSGTGGFWAGKGKCGLTGEKVFAGKQAFFFTNLTGSDTRGQLNSDKFPLLPGHRYRLTWAMLRETDSIIGGFNLKYQLADGRSELLSIQAKTETPTGQALGKWVQWQGELVRILLYAPREKPTTAGGRKYETVNSDTFSFDPAVFGQEPINVSLQIYSAGTGTVYFDEVRFEDLDAATIAAPAQAKTADDEEAARLLLDTVAKGQAERERMAQAKNDDYTLEIPDFTPVKCEPDYTPYPASIRNVKLVGNHIERDGKPVFLLGGEGMNPFMYQLFGLDFRVRQAFGNKITVREDNKAKRITVGGSHLPFVGTEARSYMRAGVLYWLDLLTGYIVWKPQQLRDHFPELFVTKEAFLAWRQENEDARKLRYYEYWNALKHFQETRTPIWACESFNEVSYEDHSPYNYQRFRAQMREKYGDIATANAAWGATFTAFEEVVPPGAGGLMEKVSPPAGQLKVDWHVFTEQRFGEILGETRQWLKTWLPDETYLCTQSHLGLAFDYQRSHVLPAEKVKHEDFYCGEHGGGFIPQWEGAENPDEIAKMAITNLMVDVINHFSPGKPMIDGECGVGTRRKEVMPEHEIVPLAGKWKFAPGAEEAPEQAKYEGNNRGVSEFTDQGVEGNYAARDCNDNDWREVDVPGLWGQQGFPYVYCGWYRLRVEVPPYSGRLYLCGFELADRAELYVNGRLVGKTGTWNEKFCFEVTDAIEPGRTNVLAVRVFNRYFSKGFYWGGIRGGISLSKVPTQSLPFTAGQMTTFIWNKALHGYSGIVPSYFYGAEGGPISLLNPQRALPEATAVMPLAKARLNALGLLALGRPGRRGEVAICYSMDSFRAYTPSPKFATLSANRNQDFCRSYNALTFSHYGVDVISDNTLRQVEALRPYRAVFLRLTERADAEALAALRAYAEGGGLLVVDGLSLTENNRDSSALNATDLLGARQTSPRQVEGLTWRFPGVAGELAVSALESFDPPANVAFLEAVGGEVLASAPGGEVLAVRHRLGQGEVVTIGAELSEPDARRIYSRLLAARGIEPALRLVTDGRYIETARRAHEGRELWYAVNYGKAGSVRIGADLPAGSYRVREVMANRALPSAAGGELWSAAELRYGVELRLDNLSPQALLIEPEDTPLLALPDLPAAQQTYLDEWLKLRDGLAQPRKRILWWYYTEVSPVNLPTAQKIAHAMGLGIDVLLSDDLGGGALVLRGRQIMRTPLSDYDLIVAPHGNGYGDEKAVEKLLAFHRDGGNLLLLAIQHYNHHAYNTTRLGKVLKPLGIKYIETGIEDRQHCVNGEVRLFTTTAITPHAVTANVTQYCSGGAAPIPVVPDGQCLLRAENSATPVDQREFFWVVERERGKLAVSGDCDWLEPFNLARGDNGQLWSNLLGWLTGTAPLSPEEIKALVTLPELGAQ